MSGGRLQLRSLILALLTCFALNPCVVGQVHHKVKKQEPVVAAPVAPVAPLTPAQMPVSPPEVAFTGGQLTITAPNSTLGDILREVRKQTGASVDVPGNATERVIGTFGPGPARDVLASLLNGSHFNYVLLGSATNPNALDRVMLMSKPAAEQTTQQAANNTAPQNPAAPPAPAQAAETMEFGNDEPADSQDSADIFGSADDQSNQAQQADDQQGQPQPNPFGTSGNGVKTPEQLLQELQQRQQQQGLPTPPTGGGPNPAGPRVGMPGMPGAPPGLPGTPPTPNQ